MTYLVNFWKYQFHYGPNLEVQQLKTLNYNYKNVILFSQACFQALRKNSQKQYFL